mmetsp:Transcript_84384/g.149225  ORF Transcript_84384/g.149225 Transcript_84384/m.149225 type:complete len:370 (-) Transcript_84384:51-1160(-)
MHGVAWPASLEKASDKALLRRKLLQPLARPPVAPPTTEGGYAGQQEVPALEVDRPFDVPFVQTNFAPPNRPATSSTDSGRPRTAQSAPALGGVSFPAQLRLRAPGEAPGPLGPFAGPGEALVIPLETQDAVRELVAACRGRAQVTDGACLTAWSLLDAPSEGSNQLLEPIAARRLDRTLAVEPIELVAERQGSYGAGGDGAPLRYGEGFRLRAAGCSGLYLSHGGDKGGLRWQQGLGEEVLEAPHGCRFAAHGGELGAALLLGRPLSLRRVLSPPPDSDSESEDDYEDEESCGSESESEHRKVRFQRPRKVSSKDEGKKAEAKPSATGGLLPEAARYAEEGLFSRLADQADTAFPATFFPLFAEPEPLS